MRILFILHRFPPNFLGGADIYTWGIASELQHRDHQVSVMCAEEVHDLKTGADEVRVSDEPYQGLPVRRLSFNWRKMRDPYGSLYVSNPVIELMTGAYIAQVKPDIVHVTACNNVSCSVITAAKKAGLPVVLTLTGRWHICPSETLLRWDGQLCSGRQPGMTCLRCMFGETKVYRFLRLLPVGSRQALIERTGRRPERLRTIGSLNFIHAIQRRNVLFENILSQVDHVISPSHCFRSVYSETGIIPADRIVYSPHGHKLERMAPGRYKTPSSRIRFGFTGNVVAAKGVDTLVAAFESLGQRPDARLNIFGNVDLEPDFVNSVQRSRQNGADIVFHGRFDYQEIARVLAEIDVLVVPSRHIENYPVTIAEAHAAMTPVIGSDVCGVAEWIRHEVDGLVFERGNAQDLARQMRRLIDEPGLISRMRRAIPAVKSAGQEAAELEVVYQRLTLLCSV